MVSIFIPLNMAHFIFLSMYIFKYNPFDVLGGTTISSLKTETLNQDRYGIGPKLIMLRLYIALMRGNMEKCRKIVKYHCSFVHVSSTNSDDSSNNPSTSNSKSVSKLSTSYKNGKLVTAGGGGTL